MDVPKDIAQTAHTDCVTGSSSLKTTPNHEENTMKEEILKQIADAQKERNVKIARITGTQVEVDMDFSPTGGCANPTSEFKQEYNYQIAHTDLPSGAGSIRTWVTTEKEPVSRIINGEWLDRENLDLSPHINALIDKVLEMEEEGICDPYVSSLLRDALFNLGEGKRVMITNLIHSSVAAEILGLASSKELYFAERPELLCDRYVMGKEVFYLNRDIYNVADHLAHTRQKEHFCPICKKLDA